MTDGFRKILVAVRDLNDPPAAMLRKAAAVAAPDARIELFHVLTGPVSVELIRTGRPVEHVAGALREAAERAARRLERIARSKVFESRSVSVHAGWDYPIGDAIVRRARTIRADLVVAATRPHRFGARLLLVNTDWELIREAPCPVLLVKPSGRYRRPAVVAALDPFHANDKPARLDADLLGAAHALARALGGEVHAFHAYVPLSALIQPAMMQPMPVFASDKDETAYARQVRRRFDSVAERARIPAARRHLRTGDVPSQLEAVVRRTRAQVVVMGALSRSGLKRVFVGNTAERVLDRLQCDLLTVKPRGFKSRVPRVGPRRAAFGIPLAPV